MRFKGPSIKSSKNCIKLEAYWIRGSNYAGDIPFVCKTASDWERKLCTTIVNEVLIFMHTFNNY